jgi:peptidoglycan/LPS O-acetylase OafA/YrhL
MPSSASRSRGTTRRSPRSAPRAVDLPLAERPLAVPFAAFFGLLVAAEDVYLAWLLWTPEVGWDWFMAVPLLLAVLALVGAALVLTGRARGWVVLAAAAVLPLAGLAVLAVIFAVLGGGQEVWSTLLLLVGPAGCLVLATRRPVREWTRARRSPGGRRIPARSR